MGCDRAFQADVIPSIFDDSQGSVILRLRLGGPTIQGAP